MFGALFGPVLNALSGGLLNAAEGAFRDYMNQKITREQLQEKLNEALLSTFADVEKSYAASLTATYSAFMEAASKSKLLQAVWAAVALSQLVVLLWHQVGIPAVVALGIITKYPSSGTTIDYAYALLMFCLGGGAYALKSGPGAGSLMAQLKSAVK